MSVQTIEGPQTDAVGLLPVAVTGLPRDLWAGSSTAAIAGRLDDVGQELLPSMQELLYLILLSELDPPADSTQRATLTLARVDALLALGAVEQASALVNLTGNDTPELFRRAFDVSLLLNTVDEICARMRSTPSISPTFPARIFCLARGGDWAGATLTLETGRALGFVSEDEDLLLAHFLDLGLDEDINPPVLPTHPSPLEFRMFEAIGRPLPTHDLPVAFAHADLSGFTGWKTQIESAERLARTGAIDPNRLFGLYSEQKPAASGGVWDRAAAIQALDATFLSFDGSYVGPALVAAWRAMEMVELEVPFARQYCSRLIGRHLQGEAQHIRFRMCLLAGNQPDGLINPIAPDHREDLVVKLLGGDISAVRPVNAYERAILAGFSSAEMPVRLRSLTAEDRLGEAVLRAIALLENGAKGDLDELTDALTFFRLAGFEKTARRAAIELLFLERRG